MTKKNKVFLVSPPAWSEGKFYPPLGIGYLLSAIRPDHECIAVHYQTYHRMRRDLPVKIQAFAPDVVGITCHSFNRANVRKAIRLIRELPTKPLLVVGGIHATYCYPEVLSIYGADVVVIGEGEQTFRELLSVVDSGGDLSAVRGIAFRRSRQIIRTPDREPCRTLDEFPIPDLGYFGKLFQESGIGYVITSRGCPGKCIYCSTGSYWGQHVRMNSPHRVVDEIEALVKRYGVKRISFLDDAFNLGESRVQEICSEIRKRSLAIKWDCTCRVRPVSESMLQSMVESGCDHICWGVETGSPQLPSFPVGPNSGLPVTGPAPLTVN